MRLSYEVQRASERLPSRSLWRERAIEQCEPLPMERGTTADSVAPSPQPLGSADRYAECATDRGRHPAPAQIARSGAVMRADITRCGRRSSHRTGHSGTQVVGSLSWRSPSPGSRRRPRWPCSLRAFRPPHEGLTNRGTNRAAAATGTRLQCRGRVSRCGQALSRSPEGTRPCAVGSVASAPAHRTDHQRPIQQLPGLFCGQSRVLRAWRNTGPRRSPAPARSTPGEGSVHHRPLASRWRSEAIDCRRELVPRQSISRWRSGTVFGPP